MSDFTRSYSGVFRHDVAIPAGLTTTSSEKNLHALSQQYKYAQTRHRTNLKSAGVSFHNNSSSGNNRLQVQQKLRDALEKTNGTTHTATTNDQTQLQRKHVRHKSGETQGGYLLQQEPSYATAAPSMPQYVPMRPGIIGQVLVKQYSQQHQSVIQQTYQLPQQQYCLPQKPVVHAKYSILKQNTKQTTALLNETLSRSSYQYPSQASIVKSPTRTANIVQGVMQNNIHQPMSVFKLGKSSGQCHHTRILKKQQQQHLKLSSYDVKKLDEQSFQVENPASIHNNNNAAIANVYGNDNSDQTTTASTVVAAPSHPYGSVGYMQLTAQKQSADDTQSDESLTFQKMMKMISQSISPVVTSVIDKAVLSNQKDEEKRRKEMMRSQKAVQNQRLIMQRVEVKQQQQSQSIMRSMLDALQGPGMQLSNHSSINNMSSSNYSVKQSRHTQTLTQQLQQAGSHSKELSEQNMNSNNSSMLLRKKLQIGRIAIQKEIQKEERIEQEQQQQLLRLQLRQYQQQQLQQLLQLGKSAVIHPMEQPISKQNPVPVVVAEELHEQVELDEQSQQSEQLQAQLQEIPQNHQVLSRTTSLEQNKSSVRLKDRSFATKWSQMMQAKSSTNVVDNNNMSIGGGGGSSRGPILITATGAAYNGGRGGSRIVSAHVSGVQRQQKPRDFHYPQVIGAAASAGGVEASLIKMKTIGSRGKCIEEDIDQSDDSMQPWSRRGSELDISIF